MLSNLLLSIYVQLILTTPDIRRTPYITLSGATFNKTDNSFDINAAQYTSFYKAQRNLSMLPIRAHFDEVRYKKKKPLPANNTYVAVDGFLNDVDMDPNTGIPSIFHINIDNISFLGKAVLPTVGQGGNQGGSCISVIFVSTN
jgi:hypothetical protein